MDILYCYRCGVGKQCLPAQCLFVLQTPLDIFGLFKNKTRMVIIVFIQLFLNKYFTKPPSMFSFLKQLLEAGRGGGGPGCFKLVLVRQSVCIFKHVYAIHASLIDVQRAIDTMRVIQAQAIDEKLYQLGYYEKWWYADGNIRLCEQNMFHDERRRCLGSRTARLPYV